MNPTRFFEPANKQTMLNYRKISTIASSFDPRNQTLQFVEKTQATEHFSIFFWKGRPWNAIFIEKIDQLLSAGIIQRLIPKARDKDKEEFEPRPLSMDHLGVCFVAIVICWAACCVVFVLEWITKFSGDLMRRRM